MVQIEKAHWMLSLRIGGRECAECGKHAEYYATHTDDDNIVTAVEWFCGEHVPSVS